MKTIDLNDQQEEFLKSVLEEMVEDPYSKFTRAVALSILTKLEE